MHLKGEYKSLAVSRYAPEGAVDYCIIHELSHLKHMDHSAAFWRLVGSRCPDYEKRKEELKVLNLRLMREKW